MNKDEDTLAARRVPDLPAWLQEKVEKHFPSETFKVFTILGSVGEHLVFTYHIQKKLDWEFKTTP